MGFFKNIQENARMAQYLRVYRAFPSMVKSFYNEGEFVAQMSNVWGLQKTYEATKWPSDWPFSFIGRVPGLEEHIKWAKSEGAIDKDIIWWWNLSPIDKIIIKGTDYAFRRRAIIEYTNQGKEALKEVMRDFTTYVEDEPDLSSMTPEDKKYFSSENRALPIELHDRIDIYLKNNLDRDNLSRMQQEKNNFSSANAWIRYLIKNSYL
jgi:hypothetical protein